MAHHSTKADRARPGKPPAAAAATPRRDGGSKPNVLLGSALAPVAAHTRRAMIAEAAYYIAAQRGFADGHEVEDWLVAEKQIDAAMASHPSARKASAG